MILRKLKTNNKRCARGQAASQQHFGRWLLSKRPSQRVVSIAGSTSIGRFLCLLDGLERLRTRSSVPRRVPVVARRSGERYSSLSSEWGATKRRHEAAVNAIFGDRHSYRALDRCVPRLVRGLRSRRRQLPKSVESLLEIAKSWRLGVKSLLGQY